MKRPHSVIGMIESDQRQVNVPEFMDLAEAIGVDPIALFARAYRQSRSQSANPNPHPLRDVTLRAKGLQAELVHTGRTPRPSKSATDRRGPPDRVRGPRRQQFYPLAPGAGSSRSSAVSSTISTCS